jgi:hypothetical protein
MPRSLVFKFAYATNGHGVVEHDFLIGRDNDLEDFPSADGLWKRLRASEGIDDKTAERVLADCYKLWSSRWNRNGEPRRARFAIRAPQL